MSTFKKKIFIGPCEVAGYYSNLTKGFKELSIDVDFITYNEHPFNYGGEISPPFLLKISKFINNLKNNKKTFTRILFALFSEFFSIIWAITVIFKYDVFIFGFGKTLIRYNLDLFILKALNKIVISNLSHGSEARPAYLDGSIQSINSNSYPPINKILKITKTNKHLVSKHEKLATYIIGAPFSTSYFSSKTFLNHFMIGIPSLSNDLKNTRINVSKSDHKTTVRILHSPSHPIAKGTPIIKKAILNLQKKGYKIEFILINKLPNSEVIKEIKKCDFIVDQVYSDTPLAGFAAEAAFYGKPAIVGGYGFEYLKEFIVPEMFPPSKLCKPDEIQDAIESLIINKKNRLLLGKAAKKFMHEKWNSIKVARRYIRIIENDIPENWWLDPKEVFYVDGICQSFNVTKSNIKNIINKKGIKGLQLAHNPKLEEVLRTL